MYISCLGWKGNEVGSFVMILELYGCFQHQGKGGRSCFFVGCLRWRLERDFKAFRVDYEVWKLCRLFAISMNCGSLEMKREKMMVKKDEG